MNEKSSFDAFKLCWDIIFQESAKCENKFFNAEYCKILDSRDSKFEVVENRLAYTYRYGYFNILFFEKCFLLFMNQCSEAVFPFENLKVCSLSHGPGLDIIGLLSALCILNKPLKCFPVFNAINLHKSWSDLYKALVCKAYETCIAKSFVEYFHLNQPNINLIQGDIYSTLSSEAKNYINNSNVLLMVNVFASSKASPTVVEISLKEIFTLLQPGSLIFYIGSKNNLKLFSKLKCLKQYVKCVCGPQTVTLKDLPIDEQISNIIGAKPYNCGHARFLVWQKKNEFLNSTECEQESVGDSKDDDDDVSEVCPSESSVTSFVKNELKYDMKSSDKLNSSSEEVKSESSENILLNGYQNNEENSVDNITSDLNNFKFKDMEFEEQKSKVWQPDIFQLNCNGASKSIINNNHSMSVKGNQILEETVKNNEVRLKNDDTDPVSMNGKEIISQKKSNKKSKKSKVQSLNKTEDQSLNGNAQKDNCEYPETLQKKSLLSNSCKNLIKNEKEITTPQSTNIEYLNTSNGVQSLLQRCDSLISKVEQLTSDIKNELNSRKCRNFNKLHFCNQLMMNCQAFHHCCCVRIIHSCCCQKFSKH